VLFCRGVVEHLPDPARVFTELARVARPEACLVLWVPNLLNYAMLASWLTPFRFHEWWRTRLIGTRGNTPTYYRANTPGRLVRMLARAGFQLEEGLHFVSEAYRYWKFSPALYLVAVLGSKLTDHGRLRRMKLGMVGAFRRVDDGERVSVSRLRPEPATVRNPAFPLAGSA